jgi:DNA-binding GntR family transcriptional regulator
MVPTADSSDNARMSDISNSTGAVVNRTLREQVLDHLREEILSNKLEPGTELHEVALAQSLGISRGPLREALGRLAAEGLVTITPRRGAVVTKLTRQEFVDAYQVREALESLAVRLAVPRLTDEDIATLRRLADAMVHHAAAGDEQAFFAANREFHSVFVTASGNQKLRQMHDQLINQMARLLKTSRQLRGTLERSNAEHQAIIEAVEARDAERAARLLEEHIEVPQRELDSMADEGFTSEPSHPAISG